MDHLKTPVFEALKRLGIAYDSYDHPAVFTSEDAEQHWKGIGGTPVKNLFLRNKKGDREYLVILGIEKRADLKQLVKIIGDDRFSFGSPERLMQTLGLTPGSVSPFGLINDHAHAVRVVLDRDLKSAARVSFHPNINTRTLVLSRADFDKFLAACGNPVRDVLI